MFKQVVDHNTQIESNDVAIHMITRCLRHSLWLRGFTERGIHFITKSIKFNFLKQVVDHSITQTESNNGGFQLLTRCLYYSLWLYGLT